MKIVDVAEETCRACGASLRSTSRFCAGCGAPRGASTPPEKSFAEKRESSVSPAAWDHIRPLLWLYLTYFGTSLVLGFASRVETSTVLTLWFQGADALATLAFCIVFFGELRDILRPRLPSLSGLVLGVTSSCGFIAVAGAVFIGLGASGLSFSKMTGAFIAEGRAQWVIYASISLLPAIWEELAFRGVIQTRLQTVLTPREAWLVQAGLFSVLHLAPVIFVTHFGMGLMFGWLRNRFRSIYPGMMLHGSWNALVVYGELSGVTDRFFG